MHASCVHGCTHGVNKSAALPACPVQGCTQLMGMQVHAEDTSPSGQLTVCVPSWCRFAIRAPSCQHPF